jgi:hypothetical protein
LELELLEGRVISIKVFSIIPIVGTKTKNQAKYIAVLTIPISEYGVSGC